MLYCLRSSNSASVAASQDTAESWCQLLFLVFLLNDAVGSRVDSFKLQCLGNPEMITRTILREWLEGRGVEPVTWETLIKTLRDCDLSALADEVHQKLPSSHS